MMMGRGIHEIEFILLFLLLFIVVFATLARKLQTPYPIVLVIAGCCSVSSLEFQMFR